MLIKIPVERVGVIIGSKGQVKRTIEKRLGLQIDVDSKAGNINLKLASEASDAAVLLQARDIILAMGRGFSPEKALTLLDEEQCFGMLNLHDYVGKSQSDIKRIKGRIIGSGGKTRKNIEEFTGTDISVYGHTIAIIGEVEAFDVAKSAIELLIRGSLHKNVYRFLRSQRDQLKRREMTIWKTPDSRPPQE